MAILAFSGSILSCEPAPSVVEDKTELTVSLKTLSSDCSKGSGWVVVTAPASVEWTLEISGNPEWVKLSDYSGKGNKSDVQMIWSENKDKSQRSCSVVLKGAGIVKNATFIQEGGTDTPVPPDPPTPDVINPDPVADWMELPAVPEGLYFFTHPMTIDGKKLRNYSYAWDVDNMVAHWVAYPLNSKMCSGSGRSEKWGIDAKLPAKFQPNLVPEEHKHNGTYIPSSWARGHQIPSADRPDSKFHDYNVETFYGVNMTPQNYDLNGQVWARLEQYVRDRSASFDTMYVATGCTLEGSPGVAYDRDYKAVTIPGGYFKALLGYKKSGTVGNTGVQGGYTGIAFFLKNDSSLAKENYMNYSMTISELEKKVGIDFFVNLKTALPSLSDKIESTKDNWWNK